MPTPNYRQLILGQLTNSWDLKGVTKRSITLNLKRQNKKCSIAMKNALASMLKSRTVILDNNRYRLPWQNRIQEWREEARIHNRIGEMCAGELCAAGE